MRKYVSQKDRRAVLSIGKCLFCESTTDLVVDHIIPFIKGGVSTINNLAPLCHRCNSLKSDFEIDEFYDWAIEKRELSARMFAQHGRTLKRMKRRGLLHEAANNIERAVFHKRQYSYMNKICVNIKKLVETNESYRFAWEVSKFTKS